MTQDFMGEEEAEQLEGVSLGKVSPRRGLTLGRSKRLLDEVCGRKGLFLELGTLIYTVYYYVI